MSSVSAPSGLLVDLYELTMAQSYFFSRRNSRATFDLFARTLPSSRSYFLFAGLEEALHFLAHFKFTTEDLKFLERQGFAKDFLRYLKNLTFNGDV